MADDKLPPFPQLRIGMGVFNPRGLIKTDPEPIEPKEQDSDHVPDEVQADRS